MKMNELGTTLLFRRASAVPSPVMGPGRQSVQAVSDATFIAMLGSYRAAGGIARQGEVLRRMRACSASTPGVVDLPPLDAAVVFAWSEESWWPLFQFDTGMRVRPEVSHVAREWSGVMADWELALWFVTPNCWLGDRCPVACIAREGGAVLQAARADRYIAIG